MLKFIKRNLDYIIMITGFAAGQILGVIQLVCEIPRGSTIGIIGTYIFYISLSIGLYLVSDRIKKLIFYKILVKVLSIALMVLIVIQLARLIFGL